MPSNLAVGIDVQPRGLAIAYLDFDNQSFVKAEWIPLLQDGTLENSVYMAGRAASIILAEPLALIATIELPTAKASSQFMQLWCMCGAVIAAAKEFVPVTEGITPNSWKKYSGLNVWAKQYGFDKRGIILKEKIPFGVYATVDGVTSSIEPKDLYDAIAICKAGIVRNLERFS